MNQFVIATVVCVSFYALPAQAEKAQKNWDMGCNDANNVAYDRSQHSDDYEEGWQTCNK